MSEPSLISLFVAPLNRTGIPYMVTGAVATAVYGEPRLTRDIDLVLVLRAGDARRFAGAWPDDAYYVPPLEVIEEESRRVAGGHFNVLHLDTGMRADVYIAGGDELSRWALARVARHDVEGESVAFAPVEYVIVMKLRYHEMGGSDRHLRDIAGILSVSDDAIDQAELDRWIAEYRLGRAWRKVGAFDR